MDTLAQPRLQDSLLRLGKQALSLIARIVLVFAAFGFVAMVIREVINAATNLHWIVGLITALGIFILLIWALRWIRRTPLTSLDFGENPRLGLALNLILIAVSGMLAMAFISDILYQQALVQYVSERPITLDLLFDYYGWHLIDAIPVFDVWSIFAIESPANSEGVLAELLIQIFLVFVIAASIDIYQSKHGDFRTLLTLAKILREVETEGETEVEKRRNRESALRKAQRNVDLAISLAKRNGSRTQQVDAQLAYAHISIELGESRKAKEILEKVRKLIDREEKDRDLAVRQRAVQELQEKLGAA